MTQEERIFAGKLFAPGDESLRAIKLRTHNLCTDYNATYEHEYAKRGELLGQIFASIGENSFIQGPLFVHYGTHTQIGKRFFGNFHLTIQDDARVTIGDDCNFGPGVTIVTPVHPLLPNERRVMLDENGQEKHLCYAKPVTIGKDCWLGANVVVTGGVTIGEGCVIGAGSVVTKDIPPFSLAAGVPCRVLRPITEKDSMVHQPDVLGGCAVMESKNSAM